MRDNLTMQIIVLLALSLVIIASVINRQDAKSDIEIKPSPTASDKIQAETNQPTITIFTTVTPSVLPTKVPHPTVNLNSDSQVFIYPGLKYVSGDKYESSDSPEVITTWYEKQIRNQGYAINTFVKTNSNDNVINKLVGAKSGKQSSVEIRRSPGENVTTVIINLDK